MRIVLTDGSEETVRRYEVEEGVVRIERDDGSSREIELADVDTARTFERNAGLALAAPAAPAPGEPVLELRDRSDSERGDYGIVEGRVSNISGHELSNVVARVVGEDGDGAFITAEEALLDWNPLASGRDSPFRVVLRSAGRVRSYRLEFRVLLGDPLPHRVAVPAAG